MTPASPPNRRCQVLVAEDSHRVSHRHAIVLRPKQPADRRPETEEREVAARDEVPEARRLDVAVDRHIEWHRRVARHREARHAIANQFVGLIGESVADAGLALLAEHEQRFRITDGQRLPQDGVDEREQRRVRADADGEREHRGRRESRTLPKCPDRVTKILTGLLEGIDRSSSCMSRSASGHPRCEAARPEPRGWGPAALSKVDRSSALGPRRFAAGVCLFRARAHPRASGRAALRRGVSALLIPVVPLPRSNRRVLHRGHLDADRVPPVR